MILQAKSGLCTTALHVHSNSWCAASSQHGTIHIPVWHHRSHHMTKARTARASRPKTFNSLKRTHTQKRQHSKQKRSTFQCKYKTKDKMSAQTPEREQTQDVGYSQAALKAPRIRRVGGAKKGGARNSKTEMCR